MIRFPTMTVGGLYGQEFEADDVLTAADLAEAAGYDVLDVTDDVIVIAD